MGIIGSIEQPCEGITVENRDDKYLDASVNPRFWIIGCKFDICHGIVALAATIRGSSFRAPSHQRPILIV